MLDYRLFPNVKLNDDVVYENRPEAREYPLLQIVSGHLEKRPFRLLLVGEGSIGKSTSLRLLEADLMVRDIPCVRHECRHLTDERIAMISQEINAYPSGTVVMIDAYDELNKGCDTYLNKLISSLQRDRPDLSLLVTSRNKPENGPYDDMTPYTVETFTNEQIDGILVGRLEAASPIRGLLHNTMFLSMFLQMESRGVDVTDVEDEASFMLRYFEFLLEAKNASVASPVSLYTRIGKSIFLQRTGQDCRDSCELPEAFHHILTEEGNDDRGYTVTSTQIKYENFFMGFYIKRTLIQERAGLNEARLRELFDHDLIRDHTDAYAYAGQLLRKEDKGPDALRKINERYPKSFCPAYSHVLLLYLGMNRGCFNCGSIPETTFSPEVFGLCLSNNTISRLPPTHTHTDDVPRHRVPDYAFCDCPYIREITVPSDFDTVGNSAFSGCSNLTSFSTEEGPCAKPEETLENKKSYLNPVLRDILPERHSIGWFAFRDCEQLETIQLPQGATKINGYAFWNCKKLKQISLKNVKIIGQHAFQFCTNLSAVADPYHIENIKSMAFAYCEKLQNFIIGESVYEIEGGAFGYCDSLSVICFLSNRTAAKAKAFPMRPFIAYVPHGRSDWYHSQLHYRQKCTVIETDFDEEGKPVTEHRPAQSSEATKTT